MRSKRRISRVAVVAATIGVAFAAVVAATAAPWAVPSALTPAAVGPGYPWVAKALAGHKGPAGCAKTYNVWYVNPLPTTPDWGRSAKIFKAAGPLLCYKPTVTGPNK